MITPVDEMYAFEVTTPAGTTKAAPQDTAITIPIRTLSRAEVLTPPGANGVVGWRLAMAGQQVIPVNAGAWVVAAGETVGGDFVNLPVTGAWHLVTYNTGINPHTLYVRFYAGVLRPAPPPPIVLAPDLTGLSSASSADLGAFAAALGA